MKTQSQTELRGGCSPNSMEMSFSCLFLYAWSQSKLVLLSHALMHGLNSSGIVVSVLSYLYLRVWKSWFFLFFFPTECFRKIKWTNAKTASNHCHQNISLAWLGPILQWCAMLLCRFPPDCSHMKAGVFSDATGPPHCLCTEWKSLLQHPC